MVRLPPTERIDTPSAERRRFLKQIATTGAVAGAAALPAWAQEKSAAPATPDLPAGQPLVAETLARYAINLKYEDISPEVVRETKRHLIDRIGCGLGGFGAEPSQIANKLAAGVSAVRGATFMCSGVVTSPDLAVFANGVMIRYLDFNDGYLSLGGGHPSDTIASLLSTAEIAGRSGRDLITSMVLTYEVFCRVCEVLDNRGDRRGLRHHHRPCRRRRCGPHTGAGAAVDHARDRHLRRRQRGAQSNPRRRAVELERVRGGRSLAHGDLCGGACASPHDRT